MELNGMHVLAYDGAELLALNKDGETVRQVTLSVGKHDLTQFRTLAEFGDIELVNVSVLNRPADNSRITPFERRIESDCNADWKPSVSIDPRIQRQFDQRVLKMVRKNADGERERERQNRVRLATIEKDIIARQNHPEQELINKKELEKEQNDGTIRTSDTNGHEADTGTRSDAAKGEAETHAAIGAEGTKGDE